MIFPQGQHWMPARQAEPLPPLLELAPPSGPGAWEEAARCGELDQAPLLIQEGLRPRGQSHFVFVRFCRFSHHQHLRPGKEVRERLHQGRPEPALDLIEGLELQAQLLALLFPEDGHVRLHRLPC